MNPYREQTLPQPPRAPRLARGIAGLSGVVLAVTFFLPAVRGCDANVIPAHELAHHPPSDLGVVFASFMLFSLYVVAYLLAAMLAASALGRFVGADWGRRLLAASALVAVLEL